MLKNVPRLTQVTLYDEDCAVVLGLVTAFNNNFPQIMDTFQRIPHICFNLLVTANRIRVYNKQMIVSFSAPNPFISSLLMA